MSFRFFKMEEFVERGCICIQTLAGLKFRISNKLMDPLYVFFIKFSNIIVHSSKTKAPCTEN